MLVVSQDRLHVELEGSGPSMHVLMEIGEDLSLPG
jgi:hypothetical protein